ncbi:MAG: hypothetical protein ACI8RD_003647, partial [Bacillariaceae sp.]|jgi:hypothetical protein
VASSRVYDPEAEDIFGSGFFAFQVHVSYRIVVESSNQSIYFEIIQEIVNEGFDIVSNGQRQFRSSLHANPLFLSVISVKTRSGLTPPVEPPTPKPTRSPTYQPTGSPTDKPSKKPTKRPTVMPTDEPTDKPSKNPTQNPSMTPSFSPSVSPSTMRPSDLPSLNPSENPSDIPSFFPSYDPSTSPSTNPSASLSTATTPDLTQYTTRSRFLVNKGAVIAGIVGTSVLFISICLLIALFCYRCRKDKPRDRYPFPTEVALSQNIHGGYVPGIVELGDEQQSLADTTLGDQEAGLIWTQRKYNSQQAIQPLGSFDENSVYTTPFEVDEEEYRATIMPIPTVRTCSSLSLMTPLEYEDRVVFPASGSTTDESSEEDIEFPLSLKRNKYSPTGTAGTASTTTNTSIPVDVDSNEPYYDDLKITKIEPLDPRLSAVLENEDFTRNPSDLDVWSCDFEDFDRGSDFYRGEESSRSTSLSSSASTHQIYNGTPASILSKEVGCLDTMKEKITLSTPSTVLQSKVGGNPNALVAADGINKDNKKLTPSSPESSKASRSSSKKSTLSNLSQKAKTGTDEYRPHHNSRDGKNNDARSGGLVSPLTKLFESMSIPTVTPEGNESENSGRTGSKSGSLSRGERLVAEVNKSSDDAISDDDDDSGMSASPWLLEEIENILGPKGVNADISSLSGKSSIRSSHSKSKRQPNNGTRRNGSEASYGSNNSRFSHHDVASIMSAVSSSMSTTDILLDQQPEEISYSTSRSTLEDGIKRLEMQLAALDPDQDNIEDSTSSVTMSSITGASFTTSISARSRHNTGKSTKGRRVLVLVPSGKLGVILTDQHDGKGTVISSIKNGSPVDGILKQGDKLIAVDDVRVEKLSCSQITSLIASRADRERRFTVITNSFNQSVAF